MKQFLKLIKDVRDNGDTKSDRTGTGTKSIFGLQMDRIDLRDGFPLMTTKKVNLKAIAHELIWFFSGDNNIKYLTDNGVNIWKEWQDENGSIGEMYGAQWMRWKNPDGTHIDQIAKVLHQLKTNPDSRRMVVTSWNPSTVPDDGKTFSENIANGKGALANCHGFFQCFTSEISYYDRVAEFRKKYVDLIDEWDLRESEYESKMDEMNFPKRFLDLKMYQRSADLFIGKAYNIASYALLMHLFAVECNMIPRYYTHTLGDGHIYLNHLDQVDLQLSREPRQLPTLILNPDIRNVMDFKVSDINITNYNPHGFIKAKIAV